MVAALARCLPRPVSTILPELNLKSGDETAVLVNGLGATPLEEQYIVTKRIYEVLSEKGIRIFHTYVGEYATSMEMAGQSISVLKLDDELKRLLAAPANAIMFKQFQLDANKESRAILDPGSVLAALIIKTLAETF